MIALKSATHDFYSLPTWPRTASKTYAQVVRAQSCTNHVQTIERWSRATCRVPRKGNSAAKFWQSFNRIPLSSILLAETVSRWRRGGSRCTLEKPLTTRFMSCHILKPENSNPDHTQTPTFLLLLLLLLVLLFVCLFICLFCRQALASSPPPQHKARTGPAVQFLGPTRQCKVFQQDSLFQILNPGCEEACLYENTIISPPRAFFL